MMVLALLVGPSLGGEKSYVTPRTTVWLRSGPGVEYKIIDRLKVGEQVEVQEEGDGWVRVLTAKGKEGWLLKRYLSEEPPPVVRLSLLEEECGSMKERFEQLQQEHREAVTGLKGCESSLQACTSAKEEVAQELAVLKQDSADVVKTKERLAAATKELEEAKRQLVTLKRENAALKSGERLKWFLAGGGVLLLGWLVGLASGRGRRKRPSLL